jgi:uncharacterized membrane protein YraQ (UPF0718 family)
MSWLWMSLYDAVAMLWMTFWALVLGFTISGVLQVFVSREQMTHAFGRTNLRSVAIATGFGAASSSCSYAAVAAARSAIQQGAALVPALAFMFASTNLVVELGAVLWLLMGWQFVAAEILGAFVLIALMWLLMGLFFPKKLENEIRQQVASRAEESGHHHHHHHGEKVGTKWGALADAFVMDWSMVWKEIAAGFLIAGFLATLMPQGWWEALFLHTGSPALRLIENALVGPLIAVISFVCSIGNIPLASLLWAHGISFGGVISFIYADLIVIPIIIIYAKYYGVRAAAWITGIFYIAMVLAGIIVDLVFRLLGWIPRGPRPPSAIEHAHIIWNYTTWLDIIAAVFVVWLLFLHFSSGKKQGAHAHAHH